MVYFLIYLIVVLDNIRETLSLVSVYLPVVMLIILVCLIIYYIIASVEMDDNDLVKSNTKLVLRYLKKAFIWLILIVCINALLPSSKDAAMIFAGGYGYDMLTSESGQELVGETADALKRLLKQVGVEEVTK